jgi:Uncharacterized protein conserved in bacteria
MATTRVAELAGIPIFYDRFNEDSYGEQAVPIRPFIENGFLQVCQNLFGEMNAVFTDKGYPITQIWTGGVGRAGSGKSYHHQHRAFDLDALVFDGQPMWIADTFPERPFLYLAIESILRKHVGTVLNFDYNAAHEDHFHFDDGTSVGFKSHARSHTLFVQHALVKLFNQDIGTAGADGVYGGDTEYALTSVRRQLNIGGFSQRQNWLAFLDACAEAALDSEAGIVFAAF